MVRPMLKTVSLGVVPENDWPPGPIEKVQEGGDPDKECQEEGGDNPSAGE